MREGAGEGVEDGGEEAGVGETGAVGGVADLLVMNPALGVFAGDVEPGGRRVWSGPTDGNGRGIHVDGGEVGGDEVAGEGEQLADEAGTEAASGLDPGGVAAVDEVDEGIPIGEVAGRGLVRGTAECVAAAGEDLDVDAEEVDDDVVDGPAGADGWEVPLLVRELGEEGEEGGAFLGKEGAEVERAGGGDGHTRFLLAVPVARNG